MRYTSSGKVGYGPERGIVEKHPDLITIAELASGSDRTHIDRVKFTDTSQVNDQPGRAEMTDRLDKHLP
ncbi:hypothetical protein OWR29_37690 [Actinoplanes sp. Pm04-4]|uniref:Uncharacterized protein n=1 Tax=Paractinoplanes pyxinae TaxID=2997416 RepID=A0ABT4BB62_9ACTN|nr:hypothetical protein [Actinoplanes pyxinae]